MRKKTYTFDEVMRLIRALEVRARIVNPELEPGDLKLLESLGFTYHTVDNSFGGYSFLKFTGEPRAEQTPKLQLVPPPDSF